MALQDIRRHLPVVDLPPADSRRLREQVPGEVPVPRLAVWELTLACDQKCIHCGSRAGPARPGELTTEECLDLVRQLRELGVGEVTLVGPLEAKLRKLQKRGAHYKGCGAGRHQVGIEADGAIKGCPSLGGPANIGGYFREHTLREIWERAEQLAYTRERTEAELWGYCAECYYATVCRAGCTATAEPLLGRPGNNPFCHHRAQQMHAMGLRERIELVRKGPGVPFDHGLYRLIRESVDPEVREREGPVRVDEPRVDRTVERMGPGRPVDDGWSHTVETR